MKINISKIEKEMNRNGWNYSKLADEMKISRSLLSLILSSKYKWNNLRTIEKFAKVFNVDEKDLIL